jgi:hypothetical protein
MAISKKQRRRIVVDGVPYLWWIVEDADAPLMPQLALTVVSDDGHVHVRYHPGMPGELRHVTVLGPRFRAVPGCGGGWRRFRCPAFGAPDEVQPRDVEAFVRWVTAPGEPVVEVDPQGAPLRT